MKHFFPKAVLLLSCLLLCVLFLGACSNEAQGKTTKLYVYNWGEYISDGSEGTVDVNAEFERWYYDTFGEHVEVVYSTYSSNEDMYAKLSSGTVSYDVIVPSDYMIERLIDEDMLAPLNYDNIPNVKNLFADFFGKDAVYDYYDKGNVYSVPYLYGMIGIIYNTAMVDEADIGSWGLMWNEAYRKEGILQFNNPRDAFGTAQYYLGLDVNSDDEEEWRRALELLKAQKDLVQGYVMDEIFNKMENGSAAIAAYYAGDFLSMYEENEDLDFFYPEEGTNLYIDAMCIPKGSENKEIAERYIDFMLSVDEEYSAPALQNAEYTYYASPNRAVVEDPEYIDYMNEIKDDGYEKMYGTDGITATPYENLSAEGLIRINSLWEELKSDIDVSPTIYALVTLIVVGLVFFIVLFAVKRRTRRKHWQ